MHTDISNGFLRTHISGCGGENPPPVDLCTYECTALFPFYFFFILGGGGINLIEVNTVTNGLRLIEFGGFKSVSVNTVIHDTYGFFLFHNFGDT